MAKSLRLAGVGPTADWAWRRGGAVARGGHVGAGGGGEKGKAGEEREQFLAGHDGYSLEKNW